MYTARLRCCQIQSASMAGHNVRSRQNSLNTKVKKSNLKKANLKQEQLPAVSHLTEPWAPSAHSAFKALLSARLCAAVWSNISDCDESYNYWEPTHFFLYGSGFQTWEYSPAYAIRSYVYILIHALPGWIYSHLLQANKVLVFYFIRCILGFTCALCELYFYKGICHRFGAHNGRMTLIFLIFSAGMFISSAAYLPSSFTMYFTLLSLGAWFLQNYPIAIISVAVSTFVGWPFAAILGIPIALDVLFIQKKLNVFVKWCIVSIVFVLIPVCQLDSFLYGKFVCASLNIILYNVFSAHGPNIYGVEPWPFYFFNGFLNFNFIFLAALAVLPALVLQHLCIKSSKQRSWNVFLILLPFYLWIAIFFTRPHKEERFLFPIYPLICLCAAVAIDAVQKLWFHLFVKLKVNHYLDSTGFIAILFALIPSIISLSRIITLYRGYHAPLETYMTLGQLDNLEAKPAGPINLCVGKEWYRFPSSFFLPQGWQLQFIESEFRGQLPKQYSNGKNATAIIPEHMNDLNLEERSRYIDIKSCHYLIDLDSNEETDLEPRYSSKVDDWVVVTAIPFLDVQRSHQILRAFYIPFFSDVHCHYTNYNLLKVRPKERKNSRKV